jgi:sortase (surface protein transpeptidase)
MSDEELSSMLRRAVGDVAPEPAIDEWWQAGRRRRRNAATVRAVVAMVGVVALLGGVAVLSRTGGDSSVPVLAGPATDGAPTSVATFDPPPGADVVADELHWTMKLNRSELAQHDGGIVEMQFSPDPNLAQGLVVQQPATLDAWTGSSWTPSYRLFDTSLTAQSYWLPVGAVGANANVGAPIRVPYGSLLRLPDDELVPGWYRVCVTVSPLTIELAGSVPPLGEVGTVPQAADPVTVEGPQSMCRGIRVVAGNATNGTAPPSTMIPSTPSNDPSLLPPGAELGHLAIPSIGVDTVVVQGDGLDVAATGPLHIRTSPMPGQPGNVVLFGHRSTLSGPFERIQDLKPGDPIVIDVDGHTYRYAVTNGFDLGDATTINGPSPKQAWITMTPGPGELGVPELLSVTDRDRPLLLLVTYDPAYSAEQRIVVEAELVP